MTSKIECPGCQELCEVLLPYPGHKLDCTNCGSRVVVVMRPASPALELTGEGSSAPPVRKKRKIRRTREDENEEFTEGED